MLNWRTNSERRVAADGPGKGGRSGDIHDGEDCAATVVAIIATAACVGCGNRRPKLSCCEDICSYRPICFRLATVTMAELVYVAHICFD